MLTMWCSAIAAVRQHAWQEAGFLLWICVRLARS